MGVMNSGMEALIVQYSSWTQFDMRIQGELIQYSQETLQYKNIYKYKLQMIYSRNYTGTPTHLLAQFLQIP